MICIGCIAICEKERRDTKVQQRKSNPVWHELKKEYLSASAQVRRDLSVYWNKISAFDLIYAIQQWIHFAALQAEFGASNSPPCSLTLLTKESMQLSSGIAQHSINVYSTGTATVISTTSRGFKKLRKKSSALHFIVCSSSACLLAGKLTSIKVSWLIPCGLQSIFILRIIVIC